LSDQRFFVLFNPGAGRGRGRQRRDAWLELLHRHLRFDYAETTCHEDIARLTDKALAEGYRNIVAVGGDGTWSLVADRIVRSGRPDLCLGVLPAGTGNDFGKSFGVTWQERESAVRAMAEGRSREVDVGRVEGRHFLNVFGCGFDVACIDDASRFTLLRGELLYKYCALRQLFRYRGKPLSISVDGGQESVGPSLLVVISNARYFGGSFDIAPWADLSDGKLDMVAVGDAGPFQRARLFQTVSAGRHKDGGLIRIRSAPSFTLEFEPPMRYELDGEVYATNAPSIHVESVPAALEVFSPQGELRD